MINRKPTKQEEKKNKQAFYFKHKYSAEHWPEMHKKVGKPYISTR